MRFLILVALVTSTQLCQAQENIREYFNEWGGNTSQDSASYFTEWTKLDGRSVRTAYYLTDNKIKFTETFKKNIKEGRCTYYHKNGKLQSEVNYYNNYPTGIVKSYYPDGSLHREELYDSARKANKIGENPLSYKLINFYDSAGNWLTVDGFGLAYEYEISMEGLRKGEGKIFDGKKDSIWVSHFTNGQLYYAERWNKGSLIEGKSFGPDGKAYTYQVVEKMAEPVNGIATFYTYVGRTMKYPTKARFKGIEGTVFTEFVVEKDGSISRIKVIRGIGGGCDEEAVRVIGSSRKWNPGLQRGRPVRSKFNLALIFKLN